MSLRIFFKLAKIRILLSSSYILWHCLGDPWSALNRGPLLHRITRFPFLVGKPVMPRLGASSGGPRYHLVQAKIPSEGP